MLLETLWPHKADGLSLSSIGKSPAKALVNFMALCCCAVRDCGAAAGLSSRAGSSWSQVINGKCHLPLLFLKEQHQKWSLFVMSSNRGWSQRQQSHNLLSGERPVDLCVGKNKGGSCFQLSEMEIQLFCLRLW